MAMITANYEMKRFLRDCGMDWADTYLEYLPEEIMTLIYKFVMDSFLKEYVVMPPSNGDFSNEYGRTQVNLRRREKYIGIQDRELRKFSKYETLSPYTITLDFDELFPYGYVKQCKNESDLERRYLKFTDSVHHSFWDGSHYIMRAKEARDKKGQIQGIKYLNYLGVCFKSTGADEEDPSERSYQSVQYERGCIKEEKLQFHFKKGDYHIVMKNYNKITSKTKKVEFIIYLNWTNTREEWGGGNRHMYVADYSRKKLDAKISIENMFDESKNVMLRIEKE